MKRSAHISPDGLYRYELWRIWDDSLPLCSFGALNPSKADAEIDDPTIIKEISLATLWGFGGFMKWNLFAFRSTDPAAMFRHHGDIVGTLNTRFNILQKIKGTCKTTVVCWGTNSKKAWRERILERGDSVLRALVEAGITPMCLGKNMDGTPKHPLYLPLDTALVPFFPEAAA